MKTHANNPPSSGCISILMLLFLCLSFSCSNEDMQENLSGKEQRRNVRHMSEEQILKQIKAMHGLWIVNAAV